jgi:hypothetical protein
MTQEPERRLPAVLWIGERSEYETTDFDGQVRRGVILGRLEPGKDRSTGQTYLWIRLEPPLSLNAMEYEEVVIAERHAGDSLLDLGRSSISVYVFEVGTRDEVERGEFESTRSGLLAWADVALDPADLPESQEQRWDRLFERLESFARREGPVRVPPDHEEDGLSLGVWVQNQKRSQLSGRLRPEWVARLEGVPGWEWFQADEFALLEAYARREGHTDVPSEHIEDERPLGQWLASVRSSRQHLPPDWIARLEAIPNWHW